MPKQAEIFAQTTRRLHATGRSRGPKSHVRLRRLDYRWTVFVTQWPVVRLWIVLLSGERKGKGRGHASAHRCCLSPGWWTQSVTEMFLNLWSTFSHKDTDYSLQRMQFINEVRTRFNMKLKHTLVTSLGILLQYYTVQQSYKPIGH